ncbi:MAG: copper resistance protein CopC, partial [Actinobacteria bacterium]|nr:copper resistance protein CopC [Actinomycetota bacterium]
MRRYLTHICAAVFATLVTAALILFPAGAAHAQPPTLVDSTPAAGATVENVSRIELRFSEPVRIPADSVRLTTLAGEAIATGTPVATAPLVVTIPVETPQSGSQVLSWL